MSTKEQHSQSLQVSTETAEELKRMSKKDGVSLDEYLAEFIREKQFQEKFFSQLAEMEAAGVEVGARLGKDGQPLSIEEIKREDRLDCDYWVFYLLLSDSSCKSRGMELAQAAQQEREQSSDSSLTDSHNGISRKQIHQAFEIAEQHNPNERSNMDLVAGYIESDLTSFLDAVIALGEVANLMKFADRQDDIDSISRGRMSVKPENYDLLQGSVKGEEQMAKDMNDISEMLQSNPQALSMLKLKLGSGEAGL